ncbi:hypothetical protein H8D83_00595 [Candidatus Woesearchaeota archaeon]|nr:hypothetical protein [Candidatus Woesearchaeota archaeon]MBL7050572.1 hypothetical protein [Candidatus Woesearchaeota archaeon]
MKKEAILIILLLLISFGFGCSSGKTKKYDIEYHKGTQALTLRFLPHMPPNTVYSGDVMDVIVEISNRGAYDVEYGEIYLTGFDTSIIPIFGENPLQFNVDGKNEYNHEGSKAIVQEELVDITLPEGVDRYNTQIEAIACYDYQTTATIPICVDPNPRINTHDACQANDVGGGGGQGAPVAITSVQVEPGYEKLRLILTINNAGNGVVIDGDACPFGYRYEELGNVRYDTPQISGISLNCEPNGMIKLIDGSAKIYCSTTDLDANQAAFKSPLTMTLDYGYKSSTRTSLEVRSEI